MVAMSRNEEITAIFRAERHRFMNADGDVCVGMATLLNDGVIVPEPIAIKGPWDIDELRPSQTYRFYGQWSTYRNPRTRLEERQFHFSTFTAAEPFGREGVISYLRYAGEGNGIGIARATKLWEIFGGDAVRILREDPERVATQIKGLDFEQARAAAEWLKREQIVEAATIELTNILAGRGFPRETARKAIKEWGNKAAKIVRRDPYSLMNFRGCGFKRCDNLWLELGLPANRLRRQALCAWYAVASDSEGHTWYPVDFAICKLAGLIGTTDIRPAAALKVAKRIGRLSPDRNGALAFLRSDHDHGVIVSEGGTLWTAEGRKAWCENILAESVVTASREPVLWPDVNLVDGIDDHQREQLKLATIGPIGILGGSPGTGKTYTAARLIALLGQEFGIDQIAVGAPTGKAAVRITEAMNGYGLSLRARTWHSLLGIGKSANDSGNWGFQKNESSPFTYRVLIGDESSMLDTNLMSSILRARPAGTLLLWVGDVNQLPPVGHGAPLRDLIAAGFPYGELREIKRNSGGIVEACAAIRDGKSWAPGDNLQVIESLTPERQLDSLLAMIRSAIDVGLDPIWDVQPVVAVNAKSPLARKTVNELLQKELNPASANRTKNYPFAVRDKIVNTKNGFFRLVDENAGDIDESDRNDQGEVFVANGELAEVLEVADKHFVARLSAPARVIRIPREKSQDNQEDGDGENSDKTTTGCSWDLGYALSVHKSQGSEWPWVVVLIDEYPGARKICSREFWYTAISRAKSRCILIGKNFLRLWRRD